MPASTLPLRRHAAVLYEAGPMDGFELPCRTATEVGRAIRALGGHRYVAGRLILVHAALFDAVRESVPDDLRALLVDAFAWAKEVLSDPTIDPASRDERLMRRSTEKELAAALEAMWGDDRERAKERLTRWLTHVDLLPAPEAQPFDEAHEEDMHPVLVDAGWELLSLGELDPERHRGAIDAFEERIDFEAAKFEEAEAIPKPTSLHELSAIGPVEALRAMGDDGILREPLVLFMEGEPTYLDYVLRGILRSAKLT